MAQSRAELWDLKVELGHMPLFARPWSCRGVVTGCGGEEWQQSLALSQSCDSVVDALKLMQLHIEQSGWQEVESRGCSVLAPGMTGCKGGMSLLGHSQKGCDV